jgi:hypothetical protein
LDYRRLHWSRWFRFESLHSLLFVPSKPGVFALAEEITSVDTAIGHVEAGASPVPQSEASDPVPNAALGATVPGATAKEQRFGAPSGATVEERPFRAALDGQQRTAASAAARRLLAVTQFFEEEDMAFVLDRMLSHQNPMRARLLSGRYFVRFVVIEDQSQRRSICTALNQWIASASEKATGIGSHFATSLELTPATEYVREAAETADAHVGRTLLSANPDTITKLREAVKVATPPVPSPTAPHLNSGAATNIHCPTPFPSGF